MTTISALQLHALGGPENVHLAHIPKPAIQSDTQILIRVKAATINPADWLYAAGHYVSVPQSFPAPVGLEGAGVIEAAGKSSGYQVGQRVQFVASAVWAEYTVVDTTKASVVPLPDQVSFEEGAQLTVNPVTAYEILEDLGAKKGEYLISTAASSSLGRILITLAKERGIKTINIVRRDEHIESLKAIGADYVINSEKEDIVKRVHEIIPGGAKYAVDAVIGKTGTQVLKAIANEGIYLAYGGLSGASIEVGGLDLVFRGITLRGYSLYKFFVKPREQIQAAYGAILALILSKKLPLPYKAFDGKTHAKEAFAHSLAPGKLEKTVLLF